MWRRDSLFGLLMRHTIKYTDSKEAAFPGVQDSTFCTQSTKRGQSRCHQAISKVTAGSDKRVSQLK